MQPVETPHAAGMGTRGADALEPAPVPPVYGRAAMFGLRYAALFAALVSPVAGPGLAITVAVALVGSGVAIGLRSRTGVWLASIALLTPWLVVRDNTWLAICIVCTAILAIVLAAVAATTAQEIDDLSLGALLRRSQSPGVTAPFFASDSLAFALARGLTIAVPIVGLFWALLASADDVFARVASPSIVPFGRGALFVLSLPVAIAFSRTMMVGRASNPEPKAEKVFGRIEASVVLGAVSALFSCFISLRLASGEGLLSDVAWRGEVRSGFFQLLWVAALTVVLVLTLRQVTGGATSVGRVRNLALLTICLAAIIDVLALLRIAQYVERSFLSSLRFWSFGFGLWLLVVLALAAARIANVRPRAQWFTAALVTSWVIFVFVIAILNPDHRIAEHNFAHPPTGEDEWIAVLPLIWLSEDATPVIVDNVETLRPLPDDRYERMVDHLCTRRSHDSWRDLNFSRRAARDAIIDLCTDR